MAAAALVAGVAWAGAAYRRQSLSSDLQAIFDGMVRQSRITIAGVAVVSVVIAGVFATRSVAGADASGYVSEAAMLSRGELIFVDDLADLRRGFDAYLTSPLGWRPASDTTQAPTYPPGLPLLMAVPHAIAGLDGAASVVAVSAALAVLATGMLAARLSGGVAGILAAILLAFTPVFLFQSIQPMSDVPVTAVWMLCFAWIQAGGRYDTVAGLACAMAVLIRPNLAPLAIVPLWMAHRRAWFAAPVAIAGVMLAALQQHWYGSPFRSGYGSTDELFALANIAPNAARYASWTLATAPMTLLGVLGMFRFRQDRRARGLTAFACLVVAAYLVYTVFDEWSYLRFLLPALAAVTVLAAGELAAWIDRVPGGMKLVVLFAIALGVSSTGVAMARERDTFSLADQLARIERVAADIRSTTPASAVLVTGEQSGSMRYASGRSILRWEAATPDALRASFAALDRASRPVFIVLDAFEEPLFRSKFAGVPESALDWPPVVEAGTARRTRVWRLSDRERFLRGDTIDTRRLP